MAGKRENMALEREILENPPHGLDSPKSLRISLHDGETPPNVCPEEIKEANDFPVTRGVISRDRRARFENLPSRLSLRPRTAFLFVKPTSSALISGRADVSRAMGKVPICPKRR